MNISRKLSGIAEYALCAVLCLALTLFSSTSQAYQHLRTRHVPEVVKEGTAQLVNAMPDEKSMFISIILPSQHEEEIDRLLAEIYNPQSPQYHHYLTPQQATERFSPSQEEYNKVIEFAHRHGLEVAKTYPNRMTLDIRGSVKRINRAFNITMHYYQHPTENRSFYAPDREPAPEIDGVHILHVAGLENFYLPHHHLKYPTFENRAMRSRAAQGTGSGLNGDYIASDMRAAYCGTCTPPGGTAALTGKGQSVGMLEFGGFDPRDITLYFQTVNQPLNVVVNPVSTDGSSVAANGTDDTEQALDIEQAIGMAPGLVQVKVYISNSTEVPVLNSMLNDSSTVSNLSCSWGFGQVDIAGDEALFKRMGLQGQTMFVASGDDGAFTNPTAVQQGAIYPADSAFVVSVGATHLTTSGPGGAWASESAWTCTGNSGGGCSGGGASPDGIAIPAWQQLPGVITAANRGSTTLRNAPDVAMEGDFDNFVCSNNGTGIGCSGGLAGTSFAAPRWAAYMALVNEDAANRGDPPLGFINLELYQNIGLNAASYALAFHDVASGSNNQGSTGFKAGQGYDLVTGWGSPSAKIAP